MVCCLKKTLFILFFETFKQKMDYCNFLAVVMFLLAFAIRIAHCAIPTKIGVSKNSRLLLLLFYQIQYNNNIVCYIFKSTRKFSLLTYWDIPHNSCIMEILDTKTTLYAFFYFFLKILRNVLCESVVLKWRPSIYKLTW